MTFCASSDCFSVFTLEIFPHLICRTTYTSWKNECFHLGKRVPRILLLPGHMNLGVDKSQWQSPHCSLSPTRTTVLPRTGCHVLTKHSDQRCFLSTHKKVPRNHLSSRHIARKAQQKVHFFLLYPRLCKVVTKKYTLILSYPPVPFLCMCGTPNFGIIPWQGKDRLYDFWSLFPEGDPILKKELCFLGMHWIAPLFSQEAVYVFTLCLTNHTPQITQAKRHCKEFTFELFWTIFWQEMKCSKLGAVSHTRRVDNPWLTSLSVRSAPTLYL